MTNYVDDSAELMMVMSCLGGGLKQMTTNRCSYNITTNYMSNMQDSGLTRSDFPLKNSKPPA